MSDRSYLEEISIRGLGIIDQSNLELSKGLNVLTGETGAGKTMILTALNRVLGGKSDSALIRKGSERLLATASFSIPSGLKDFIREEGGEVEEGSILLTRSVGMDGKSKAVAGGNTVTASSLARIGEALIEVHGQAANTQIVKPARQRELLDRFGGEEISKALSDYGSALTLYVELKERISSMKAKASQRSAEIAQLQEFSAAWVKLKAVRGEYEATQDEINRLSSVEDLRVAASIADSALNGEEEGVLTALGSVRKALEAIKGKDSKLDQIAQSITESFHLLNDGARDISSYQSSLEADPDRLDLLQNRKSEINAFIKKWGAGADPDLELIQLAARAKSAKESIADLQGGDERISELEADLVKAKKELLGCAVNLTRVRQKSAQLLSKLVTSEVRQLSMPHTTFTVDVSTPDYEGALKESDFTAHGCDEVQMHIQGHKDAPKVGLGKGASGGEMSRIMLALEVVIAKTHPVGTYIFDEVDAGVGGKAAIEVGRRLHQLAQHAQVIVVTHLPQVASWADSHFVVKKSEDGFVTQSDVEKLTDSARIEEIARMLAGLEESTSAREHAAELLALRG